MIKIKSFLVGCAVMPLFEMTSQIPDQIGNVQNSSSDKRPDKASVVRQRKKLMQRLWLMRSLITTRLSLRVMMPLLPKIQNFKNLAKHCER
ncbi:MAG: hypothetical protein LH649_04585 [Pseudanabaena sp. CAN_BIN31]|nr:hypothetical protein [Pseudanabaena sp. CAN_BIN31]